MYIRPAPRCRFLATAFSVLRYASGPNWGKGGIRYRTYSGLGHAVGIFVKAQWSLGRGVMDDNSSSLPVAVHLTSAKISPHFQNSGGSSRLCLEKQITGVHQAHERLGHWMAEFLLGLRDIYKLRDDLRRVFT